MVAMSEIRNNSSNFKKKLYKLLSVNVVIFISFILFTNDFYFPNALPIYMLNIDDHSALTFISMIGINFFENKISERRYAFDWKSHLQRRAMDNIPSLIWVTRNIVSDQNDPVQLNSIASTESREG